jgi:hypothetical protein
MNLTKYYTIFALISLGLFWSCQKEVETPVACVEGPVTAQVGQVIEFNNCSTNASFGSLWTGDETNNLTRAYANLGDTTILDSRGRIKLAQGFDLPPGTSTTYSYSEPGVYTVTLIASAVADWGETVLTDITEYEITVIGEE